ncbi:MAG: polymer-forming cytoskeletal protein [Parvularculaceae bacterium]
MKSAGVPSIISADVVMKGNVNSAGEVQFDGTIEGDIKASCLIIGEKASVKGEVICETVTVRGRVEGGIRAKSVSLASTAHIQGDILHSSLSVETGAHFEGNCRHSDDPLSEAAAKDFRRSRPAGGAPAAGPRPALTEAGEEVEGARQSAHEAPSFLSQSRSPLR